MPEYNGNDVYIEVNGVDVRARWRNFTMSLAIGDENTSAGAGVQWEKHNSKLMVITGTLTLIYDDMQAAEDFRRLHTYDSMMEIKNGPEGNAPGKPKHHQMFLATGINGPSPTYDKAAVLLEYSVTSSGEPFANIYAGDTF